MDGGATGPVDGASSAGSGTSSTCLPPTDSSDVQLRLTVRSDSGPATELLTFDFPAVRPAATTLRLRWGTVVVPLEITALAPPPTLLRSPRDGAPYLGRYDLHILDDDSTTTRRRPSADIEEAGDTLLWRDADGPEAERRAFVQPLGGGPLQPRAARPGRTDRPDSGSVVSFAMEKRRATGSRCGGRRAAWPRGGRECGAAGSTPTRRCLTLFLGRPELEPLAIHRHRNRDGCRRSSRCSPSRSRRSAVAPRRRPTPVLAAVEIQRNDIFDPDETRGWVARLANWLHIRTRESVVRREVLLAPGLPFDSARAEETAGISAGSASSGGCGWIPPPPIPASWPGS